MIRDNDVFDVLIVGGGPGGATCGTLLKKYKPELRVGILERETFPRDHVGESQLPLIGIVLDEMGVWDKVEAAGFPIKVGATYRWGKSDDLWDFNFLPEGKLEDEPRPAQYTGQRTRTAFQVDRAIYDNILLNHAEEKGCEVYQGTAVRKINHEDGVITSLGLSTGQTISAKWYVDASGNPAIIRRAMGVAVEEPSTLKNVAFWDYWQNADWAVEIGVGGTRVQVMSLGYGWIWFIPLGPTRTSVGLVCPADYYKQSGMRPEELYRKALADEPRISALLKNATSEEKFETTKDWSFVAEQMAGENWLLVGEAAGFADPILAAGLTLTHASGREAAYTILESYRTKNLDWLLDHYEGRFRRRVLQHIRFADYWYSANAHFSDLKEYTREIARDAGLELDAEAAFQWLGSGGFVDEDMFVGGLGTFSFNALQEIGKRLSENEGINAYGGFNFFELDLKGAKKIQVPQYEEGRVRAVEAFERNGKILPLMGMFGMLVKSLKSSGEVHSAFKVLARTLREEGFEYTRQAHDAALQSLEALIRDGWVVGKLVEGQDPLPRELAPGSLFVMENNDEAIAKK